MEEAADIELGPLVAIPKPSSSLYKAIEDNDKDTVQHWLQWLRQNPTENISKKYESGNTAFHLAVKLNRDEILKMMLSSKLGDIDVNVQNDDDLTPLLLACIKGRITIVNLILQYASSDLKERILSSKDRHSNGPLQLAMFYGHEDVALAILKGNEELTHLPDDQQSTPLHIAAKYNLVDVIEYLLESGADIEAQDVQEHTPLMVALLFGQVNASLRLIVKGASTEGVDCEGRNIVHLAAEQHNVAVLEALDSTFLHNACKAYDSKRNTPLHTAAAKGNLNVVNFLLKENVSIDLKNCREETPLHIAAECGNARIVQRFLRHQNLALNNQDISGCTPLHLACQQGHSTVAEMLIQSGARIDLKNDNQETALVCAIYAGSNEIVKLLVEAGAGADSDHGDKDLLSLAMVKGDAGVDIAFTLLAGGLITKKPSLCERIKKMPALAEELLNQCIEGHAVNNDLQRVYARKKDRLFKLDFEPIDLDNFEKESHPLSLMVEHRRFELLKHPVIKSLIKYKWKKYAQVIYLSNLTFYAIFLIFLTSFAMVVLNPSHSTCTQAFENVRKQNTSKPLTCQGLSPSRTQFIRGAAFLVILLVLIRIIIEIFQFMRLKLGYFKEIINWLEIVLYFSTLNFVWIFHSPCFCVAERQWELGVVAVFLGWLIMTLFTDKLPWGGLYVLMFVSIFKTFLKTIVLSVLLLISFGLAFFMLFHHPDIARSPFASPFISIMRTMTMSEGEFDFDVNFAVDQGGTTPSITYPITSFFLWLIFLVLMSILLTNLLTGLAVDDVKSIQDNANLKRLKLKIDFILAIDGFTYQFQDFLPFIIHEWLTAKKKITVLVYNKLSAWQKLQLSAMQRDYPYDLRISAQEFASATQDSELMSSARWVQQCSAKRDLYLKMAELQEDTERIQLNQEKIQRQIITDLETKITELSNDNQEMKKCLSDLSQQNFELKQTLTELFNYNHWQRDVLSDIAKKLSVSRSEHQSTSE